MSAKQVVTIVGAAAAAFVGWFQYHYNVHKRKVLDSNQSMFYNSNSFHTITALVPSGELKIMFDHSDSEKLKERVDRLHDAISNAGGKRIYTGRTLTPGAVSARVPTDLIQGIRIVLVSQWESFDQFKNFRASLQAGEPGSDWKVAWSTGFKRDIFSNSLFLPMWLGNMKVQNMLGMRSTYDVKTTDTIEELMKLTKEGSKYGGAERMARSAGQGNRVMRGFTKGQKAQPVVIWNWLLAETDQTKRKSDQGYGNRMMEMLAQNGGGIMDIGIPMANLPGEKINLKWSSIAGVHYPTRDFMADLIRSRWMVGNIQTKSLGDSLNYLTVPFSSTLDLKEPLPTLPMSAAL